MTAASSKIAIAGEALEATAGERSDGGRLREVAAAHYANVWRFLRALGVPERNVEDAAQEVFLVAARKLEIIQVGAEKAFLFGTAVNVARHARRRHAREELASDPDDDSLDPIHHTTPERSLERKEEWHLLMSLLEGLTEELRTTFVLYEVEGLSIPEIAELLDVSPGTIGSRLRRSRERFEERLARHQLRMRGET